MALLLWSREVVTEPKLWVKMEDTAEELQHREGGVPNLLSLSRDGALLSSSTEPASV